jgi:hypothetical protein
MSTPYGVSRNIGSSTYNNYVNAPIVGPLSTNQYPCAMPYHSYGILPGKHPNPPLFYPSQNPPAADQNTNSRHQYWRTAESALSAQMKRKFQIAKAVGGIYTDMSTQRQYAQSGHTNYIPPVDSSLRIQKLRSNAVGKSGYKVGLPAEVPYGTKSYDRSFTNTAIRRVRSGGCVAPKKKGAIENYSLRNGMVCAWGSLPRQNY